MLYIDTCTCICSNYYRPPSDYSHVAYFVRFQDDPEDLHFKKGEVMTVLRKDEDEWWYARHSDGREGSIPVPYVLVVSVSDYRTYMCVCVCECVYVYM